MPPPPPPRTVASHSPFSTPQSKWLNELPEEVVVHGVVDIQQPLGQLPVLHNLQQLHHTTLQHHNLLNIQNDNLLNIQTCSIVKNQNNNLLNIQNNNLFNFENMLNIQKSKQ